MFSSSLKILLYLMYKQSNLCSFVVRSWKLLLLSHVNKFTTFLQVNVFFMILLMITFKKSLIWKYYVDIFSKVSFIVADINIIVSWIIMWTKVCSVFGSVTLNSYQKSLIKMNWNNLLTFTCNIELITLLRLEEKWPLGMGWNRPILILASRLLWFIAVKGGLRAHSSYSRQPRDQMSDFSL